MSAARIGFAAGVLFSASVALSFVHPWGNLRSGERAGAPLLEGSTVPPDVRRVFETKCADCHSANTEWPVYSRMAPGSWFVEHDVHEGRSHLNFSEWQRYGREAQVDLLTKIAAEARSGQMPVKHYLMLHPQARLSPAEQELIYQWAKAERKQIRQQMAGLGNMPSGN